MSSAKLLMLPFRQFTIPGRRQSLRSVAPCRLNFCGTLPILSLRHYTCRHLRKPPLDSGSGKRYIHIGSYREAVGPDIGGIEGSGRARPASPLRTPEERRALKLLSDLETNETVDSAGELSELNISQDSKADTDAVSAEKFIASVKKALRKVARYESIVVKYDPSEKRKAEIAEENARVAALKAKSKKTEAKGEARKELGEEMEPWRKHRLAMKEKFPEGWNPRKKLSPDAMEGIRALHEQFPEHYSLRVLSKKFGLSPEAVRRILKSKWRQKAANTEELADRWTERGTRIWTQMAAVGMAPPNKWEKMGIKRDMLQIGQRDAQEGNRRMRALKTPQQDWENEPPRVASRHQTRPSASQDAASGDEEEPDASLRRFSNML